MVDQAFKKAEAIKTKVTYWIRNGSSIEKVIPANASKSIYSVIKENMMSFEDEIKLKNMLKKMIYLSTPFSLEAAVKLNKLGIQAFKIGSGECNNLPLLEKIADFKKPIILSTGMNNLKSIERSVKILKKKRTKFILLHCKSEYPANIRGLKLDFITELKKISKAINWLLRSLNRIIPSISAMAKGACVSKNTLLTVKAEKARYNMLDGPRGTEPISRVI